MLLAAFGTRFTVPEPIYKFIVLLLLRKVGMSAGISVRVANLTDLLVPALLAAAFVLARLAMTRGHAANTDGTATFGGGSTPSAPTPT